LVNSRCDGVILRLLWVFVNIEPGIPYKNGLWVVVVERGKVGRIEGMEEIETKIVATIGPASVDLVKELVEAGADYVRINTAYGDEGQYETVLDSLEEVGGEVEVIWDIKELGALEYAQARGIGVVAVSFAEREGQITEVRERIEGVRVIAKIESRPGVENFEKILAVSDGIMVARGDLGRAVPVERVPPLQKEFTRKTLEAGKFLITATEMLLSMVEKPEPTRAEVSDVANAIFEHSSAVMLSEETAIGKYPVESVRMMRRIIVEAEKWNRENSLS